LGAIEPDTCQLANYRLLPLGPGTDPISYFVLLVLLLIGAISLKSLRLRRFKWDRDEIWQDCSLSKCASADGAGFSIWCHAFKMATVMSFQAEKCCHLVRAHTASAQRVRSSDHQFLFSLLFISSCS